MKNWKKTWNRLYGGRWYRRILMWLLTFFTLSLLGLLAIDNNLFGWFGHSPSLEEIRRARYVNKETSVIYSEDNVLLNRCYDEDRTWVEYTDLPPLLIHTLIDTEDERFYNHRGIDLMGLLAAGRDMARGKARGASTLTQQLAKNLFVRGQKEHDRGRWGHMLWVQKLKEWIIALKMERVLSKEDIVTLYLNTVDFGGNAYGIQTACRRYFGCDPQELKPEEAATLVGLLKGTTLYNPRTNAENCLRRRNTVLTQVYEKGHLSVQGRKVTAAQLDSLKALPLRLAKPTAGLEDKEVAPYFVQAVKKEIHRLCNQGYIEGYDKEHPINLREEGLRIYTALNTRLQRHAEGAVREQMAYLQEKFDEHWEGMHPWRDGQFREMPDFIENLARKTGYYAYYSKKYGGNEDSIFHHLREDRHPVRMFTYKGREWREISVMDSIRHAVAFLHCGMVAIEPDTREVKAWVGDVDFDTWQYDKVTALRQPGSTFKLFVYAEALNQGLRPEDRRMDSYRQYPDTTTEGVPCFWAPHNSDGHFTNREVTLHEAFAVSINSIAVLLGYECGIERIAETAKAMGILTPMVRKPSLALGASDVTLLELTNAYCTPIEEGRYNHPILITRMEDREGKVIFEAQRREVQAIPKRTASQLVELLRACMKGTSYNLRPIIGQDTYQLTDWGGKTGTSNNHSDAWFVAVTPRLVCGCWVGGEYRCIHFRTGEMGQGNKTALPVCAGFMGRVLRDSTFARYREHF